MLTRRTLLSSLATLPLAAAKLSPSDDALLEDLSRRSFRCFLEQSDPSTGITLLSAENLRTGNVWKWFMASPEAQRAMALANLEKMNEKDGE